MYANIVPILGAIIPDPLAIPITLTSKFLYLTLEIAYLGKVSVVIIDLAASSIEFTKTGFLFLMQDVIFDGFNSSPITPLRMKKLHFHHNYKD